MAPISQRVSWIPLALYLIFGVIFYGDILRKPLIEFIDLVSLANVLLVALVAVGAYPFLFIQGYMRGRAK